MNFIEAVKLLQIDENIKLKRRGENYALILDNTYVVSIEDILAEDWYVVRDDKLHTFEEALKALKSGKKIRRKNNDYDNMYYDEYYSHKDCLFDKDDIMANDWIIIDKEG